MTSPSTAVSPWVTRNIDGAQVSVSRGSQYEGPWEDWDPVPDEDACVTADAPLDLPVMRTWHLTLAAVLILILTFTVLIVAKVYAG